MIMNNKVAVKVLTDTALAHFINNYETSCYPNLNFLIALNPDTLEKTINTFITSTNTI